VPRLYRPTNRRSLRRAHQRSGCIDFGSHYCANRIDDLAQRRADRCTDRINGGTHYPDHCTHPANVLANHLADRAAIRRANRRTHDHTYRCAYNHPDHIAHCDPNHT
jgi:hypothetical protein